MRTGLFVYGVEMDAIKFLKWLIVFMLILIGGVLAYLTGLLDRVNQADVTKLSFVILGLLVYYSMRIGMFLHTNRSGVKLYNNCQFASNAFLSLGMIGTVIGFIYMLNISFGSLGIADTASLKVALQTMGTGMGTALYTTAAGLVCNLILRLELYLFMDSSDDGKIH